MKKLSQGMKWSALVGALSMLAACGGAGPESATEDVGQSEAAETTCRNDARQFAYCVNQANLLGLATCGAGEVRTTYSLLGACSASTYHTITWTCCPQ